MPSAQVRNADAQLLGGTDHLSIFDRNFAAEWYDATGGASVGGAATVSLTTERHNSAPENFVLASSIVTLVDAGLYLFDFRVSASWFDLSPANFSVSLEQDPATGVFAAVAGAIAYANVYSGIGTAHGSLLLRTSFNYRFRLRQASLDNALTTVAGSALRIVRLLRDG